MYQMQIASSREIVFSHQISVGDRIMGVVAEEVWMVLVVEEGGEA